MKKLNICKIHAIQLDGLQSAAVIDQTVDSAHCACVIRVSGGSLSIRIEYRVAVLTDIHDVIIQPCKAQIGYIKVLQITGINKAVKIAALRGIPLGQIQILQILVPQIIGAIHDVVAAVTCAHAPKRISHILTLRNIEIFKVFKLAKIL